MKMKHFLAISAQIGMTSAWLVAESWIDALRLRLFDNALLIDILRALGIAAGVAVYVIAFRLIVGKIYDVGNGKGPWTWLRLIIRPAR